MNAPMSAPFLAHIDWRRPWLTPYREIGQAVQTAPDWRAALNAAAQQRDLRNHQGLPIHFVAQSDLSPGIAYEAFISASGGVPTRDNLHDFFNALVWLTFPHIKRQLNALQAAEIARTLTRNEAAGQPIVRGKLRDAATIFDENAALLVTTDRHILEDLRAHRWQQVLLEQRSAWGITIEASLFGHALMEKLVTPYKAITAHAWTLIVAPDYFTQPLAARIAWLDTALAQRLAQSVTNADFTPLPVLGVPGWWEGQDAAFYADVAVFRPKRVAGMTHY